MNRHSAVCPCYLRSSSSTRKPSRVTYLVTLTALDQLPIVRNSFPGMMRGMRPSPLESAIWCFGYTGGDSLHGKPASFPPKRHYLTGENRESPFVIHIKLEDGGHPYCEPVYSANKKFERTRSNGPDQDGQNVTLTPLSSLFKENSRPEQKHRHQNDNRPRHTAFAGNVVYSVSSLSSALPPLI
jgi:hypothetical protein